MSFPRCRIPPTVLAGLVLAGGACGQQTAVEHDRRDRVVLRGGKELRGRVLNPFWREELVLVDGGRRTRIPRKQVQDVRTMHDDLRQFFEYRAGTGSHPKRAWFLCEWAASKGLHGLARLQALAIVLADPKATKARQFLGHRQQGKQWLWPVDGRFRTLAEFEEHHGKWGRALELTGEHFKVRTDAGLVRAVNMLFDLERLYLHWMDVFGAGLDMREALEPIEVQAWASMYKFPRISALQLPYYDLREQAARTFFRPDAQRPEQLFAVATQALIYATLVEGRPVHGRNHLCAWAEIGLGLWVASGFDGDPGRAAPLDRPRLDPATASTVFRSRPRLNRVIHLHYELYYELSERVALRWGATETLVHFLMSRKPDPKIRDRFFGYLYRVFRKGLGDSSTAFDKAMGEKIEALQPRFLRWLQVRQ